MTLPQTFRKDESFGFSGGRLLACLLLALACWPIPGHAESPRLRVVTRPPLKKSVPSPVRPSTPAPAAPQAVAIYRHVDEDGTIQIEFPLEVFIGDDVVSAPLVWPWFLRWTIRFDSERAAFETVPGSCELFTYAGQ